MTIKAVIFDFGGVFTTSPVENFGVFERQHDLPARFIGGVIKNNHHANAWARFERAEICIEEFDGLFAEETKAAGFEIAGKKLVSLLALTLRPEMVAALRRVKMAGYQTGCITNNLPQFDSTAMLAETGKAVQAQEILSLFDHVIESSKAGIRKPEPRIYELMCEALDVAPAACVFLDDLGINLKPARAMGMTTIKVPLGDVRPAIEVLASTLEISLD